MSIMQQPLPWTQGSFSNGISFIIAKEDSPLGWQITANRWYLTAKCRRLMTR